MFVADERRQHGLRTVGDPPERSLLIRADRLTIPRDHETPEVYLLRPSDAGKHSPAVSGAEGAKVRPLLRVLVSLSWLFLSF